MQFRVGIGHDTHRLEQGGPLRLGGIDIDFDGHLVGYSDADVLLHAITDALLGASGLGDIGEMFPDNDPVNQGKDSAEILAEANARAFAVGWDVVNLDCIVFAERPKILPYRDAMIERISCLVHCKPSQISLKGKTGEKTGDVGEGRVIQAMCVCLVERRKVGLRS